MSGRSAPSVGTVIRAGWAPSAGGGRIDAQVGNEQATAVDERRIAAVARRGPDLLGLFDADGEVLFLSDAAVRLFTGAPVDRQLARTDPAHRIHPDDIDELLAAFSRAKRSVEPVPVVFRTMHDDGDWRHVEGSFLNLLDHPEIRGITLSLRDVSDRVRIEGELRRAYSERQASGERFRRLVHHSPDLVMVLDPVGRITYASAAATTTFGYAPEELVGTSAFDLIHPGDVDGALDALVNALVDFAQEMIPLRVRHRDGRWIPVEALASDLVDDPVVGGLVVAVRDVSDRVEIAEALRDVQVRFRQAWEHAPIGMGFVAPGARFVRVNPAFCRMLDRDEGTMSELGLHAITHEQDLERVLALVRSLFDHHAGRREWEQRLRRSDGSWIWARVTATPLQTRDGEAAVHALVQVEDVTKQKEYEERLAYEATHDHLTGLPRRALLLDHLSLALASARRHGASVGVLFVDLDHFKHVNDTSGHEAGDALLVDIASRLRRAVREADTPGRFGGDEFVVVCPDLADGRDAVVVAERIGALLAEPFDVAGRELRVSASIGVAVAEADTSADELLRRADLAAYRAKQRGRNRFEIFDDELRQVVAGRAATERALRTGLEVGDVVVHYQPVYDLPTGQVAGFETLARWNRPGHGLLRPSEFLPVAEESGLIVPLGRRVLALACAQAAAWERDAHTGGAPFVTVNCSPRQLARGIARDLRSLLAEHHVDARRVWLEIPETLRVDETPGVVEVLHELCALGVRLALDDFGTGYASLQHLRELPVGVLKIDGTFIAELGKSQEGTAIVGSVIGLGHALHMQVIAEGVETAEQVALLREMRCDYAQGVHLSPPLTAAEATELLDRRGAVASLRDE